MPKNIEAIKGFKYFESGIPDAFYPLPIPFGSANNPYR